jgi:hypothetical protein
MICLLAILAVVQSESAQEFNSLGVTKFESGDIKKACGLFQKALDVEPTSVEALTNSAMCRISFGLETGKSLFEQVLTLNPTYQPALSGLQSLESIQQIVKSQNLSPVKPLPLPITAPDWATIFNEVGGFFFSLFSFCSNEYFLSSFLFVFIPCSSF